MLTDTAPATTEWSTLLLPTKVPLILEVWMHKVNDMVATVLAISQACVSAAMVLTWFSWNILTSPPKGLTVLEKLKYSVLHESWVFAGRDIECQKDFNLLMLCSQCHGSLCPGDTRSQGISSHAINLKYSELNIRRVYLIYMGTSMRLKSLVIISSTFSSWKYSDNYSFLNWYLVVMKLHWFR